MSQAIRLVDVKTKLQTAELRGHRNAINSLAFTADGRSLLSASDDGSVRVWDSVSRLKEERARRFGPALVPNWYTYGPAFCLSCDGRHLLAVLTNQTFCVWDTLRLSEGESRPLPFANTAAAALAVGGNLAAFSGGTGEVVVCQTDTRRVTFSAQPDADTSHRLAFSADGQFLATANNTAIRVWDLRARIQIDAFPEAQTAMSLVFSRDGKMLVAGFWGGQIKLWKLGARNRSPLILGEMDDKMVRGVALLDGNRFLISAGPDVRFWDLRARHENLRFSPRPSLFFCAAISNDGRRFAAGSEDGLITIWDVASSQEVITLNGHKERVMQLAFTPDGDHLISASRDQLRVWQAASFDQTDSLSNSEGEKIR